MNSIINKILHAGIFFETLFYRQWRGPRSSGIIAMLVMLFSVMPARAGYWQIQTVDSTGGGWPADHALALDSSGNPHLSYFDNTNRLLKYAVRNGSAWQIQSVDSGTASTLALDGSGNPHICYDYSIPGNPLMKYAAWNGSVWQYQTVTSLPPGGELISMAINSTGKPGICCSLSGDMAGPWTVDYISWDGSAWHSQVVVDTAEEKWASLALDGSDNPRISYYDGNLQYAAWNGSAWDIQTVDSSADMVGVDSSLALDASGNPHISYYNGTWKILLSIIHCICQIPVFTKYF